MSTTLGAIAKHIGGRLQGDGAHMIEGVASLEDAARSDISFAEKDRYRDKVAQSSAGAFVVSSARRNIDCASLAATTARSL